MTSKDKTHPELKDGSCLVLEFLLINLMVELECTVGEGVSDGVGVEVGGAGVVSVAVAVAVAVEVFASVKVAVAVCVGVPVVVVLVGVPAVVVFVGVLLGVGVTEAVVFPTFMRTNTWSPK